MFTKEKLDKFKMTKKSQNEGNKEMIFEKVDTFFSLWLKFHKSRPQFVTLVAISRLRSEGFKLQFPLLRDHEIIRKLEASLLC